MFFTKLGGIIAWVAFVAGALRVAMGLKIALSDNHAELAPYLLGARTSGEAIDGGVTLLVFGIGLGILVEISRSVRSSRE